MEDANHNKRMIRLNNHQQVLLDLLRATTDSLGELVLQAAAPLVVEPSGGPVAVPPSSRPQGPAEASTTNRDPLARAVPTRGTLQGLLDRLDDALERGDQAAAQGASRELRAAIDGLLI